MRYLDKTPESKILAADWRYPQDASKIREALVRKQRGFCAYSERFIKHTDSCDVEHFDPNLKNTPEDSYWNWYGVLHWMNSHKPRKIEPYLPILPPHDSTRGKRIKYEDGLFVSVQDGDVEADNLVKYLGWNRPEVAKDRANHVRRIRDLRIFFGDDTAGFLNYLRGDPENLSFITALEAELDLAGIAAAKQPDHLG
jgi:hypothetical protein